MLKLKLLVFLLTLVFSVSSKAGLFLEPYVGLSQLVESIEFSGFTSKDVAKGFHLGVRAGYQFGKRYFLGGEYLRGGPYKFTDQFNGNTSSEDTNIMLGATVGAEFGLVRFSAAYFPDVDLVFSGNSSSSTTKGTGFRAGIGLAVGKKIRANFDLFFQTMTQQELTNGTTVDLTNKIQGETAAVSVSFPFEFK